MLHDGVVILLADVQKNSFLAAFEASTGKEIWRTPRNDVPTWGTPTIHHVQGQTQIIVNGFRHAGAYDFKTGKEIWKLGKNGDIPVPTPVVSGGLIYITNAHGPQSPVYAIKETATGDITPRGMPRRTTMSYGASRGGRLHVHAPRVSRSHLRRDLQWRADRLRCQDRRAEISGALLENTSSAFTSSPVANDGKVYIASEDGQVIVLKAGDVFERIATNDMGASVLATPAISEGRLLVRTQDQLIAFGLK